MGSLRLLAVILASALLLGAGVYRWVDKEGRVHYSDVPPKGTLPIVEPAKPPAESAAGQGATKPAAPGAMKILDTLVIHDLANPARASFRLAVFVGVQDVEDAEVEAEFENPVEAGQTLRGARIAPPGSAPGAGKDLFMMASPEFSSIQCRAYRVTVRLYSGSGRDSPLATTRETIASRMDSSVIAAGGAETMQRLQKGEPVCPR